MLRRDILYAAAVWSSAVVSAGCAEKPPEGEKTATPAKRQTPVADVLPDLPVEKRTEIVGRAIAETAERDVAGFSSFKMAIERSGISIKSTKKTEKMVELKCVVTVDTDRGIAEHVGHVAGAYAAFVRSGVSYERLNVTFERQGDSTFGSFQVQSEWSKRFEKGEWSAEQYGEAVLGTLKTKR